MSKPIDTRVASAELALSVLRAEQAKLRSRRCQAVLTTLHLGDCTNYRPGDRCDSTRTRIGLDGYCLCFAHRAAVDDGTRIVEMVGEPHRIAEAS